MSVTHDQPQARLPAAMQETAEHASEYFVCIESGCDGDDEPVEIADVRLFASADAALCYAQELSNESEGIWQASRNWLDRRQPMFNSLFDDVVRPVLHRAGEPEARERLNSMIEAELGPQPSLDGMCGQLDVFRCREGAPIERLWANYRIRERQASSS